MKEGSWYASPIPEKPLFHSEGPETACNYYREEKNRPIRLIILSGISKIVINRFRFALFLVPPSLKSDRNFFPHEGQAISIPPMSSGNRNCWPHLGHFFSVSSIMVGSTCPISFIVSVRKQSNWVAVKACENVYRRRPLRSRWVNSLCMAYWMAWLP